MDPAHLWVQSLDYQCPERNELIIAHEVTENCYVVAGQAIGPFSVQVMDASDRPLSADMLSHCSMRMVIRDQEKDLASGVSKYDSERHFWFKEYEGLRTAGSYSITFSLTSSDSSDLPELAIAFKVIPCPEIASVITPKPSECFRIGESFDISLKLLDQFDNMVEDVREQFRASISSTGLDFSVTNTETIGGEIQLNVIAAGKIDQLAERSVPLVMIEAEICLYSADSSSEDSVFRVQIQLKFKAGVPEELLLVDPEKDEKFVIENGTLPQFGVRVVDAFGNMVTTAIEPKLAVIVIFGEYTAAGGRKEWSDEYNLSFMTGPNGSPCVLKGGPTLRVDLNEDNEKKLFARLSLPNFPSVNPIFRDFFIQKCAKPSDIRIFCSSEFDSDTICEIRNGETMNWTAAQMIRNVSFKMLDDQRNEIAKPNLTMSNFRVSWYNAEWVPSGSFNIKSVNAGKLPDIRAPKNDGEVANFNVTFYEASAGPSVKSLASKIDTSSISFQFSIKALVGAPVTLCASFQGIGENKIGSGSLFEKTLVVYAEDSCGNRVTDVSSEDVDALDVVPVKGNLDRESLDKGKGYKAGEIHVKGIRVVFDEDLPCLELQIKFMNLLTTLSLDVMAGLPAKLQWIPPKHANYDNANRLFVTNKIPAGNWSLQVTDKFLKPTKYAGLVVVLGIGKKASIKSEHNRVITNSEGIADFGLLTIMAKDDVAVPTDCPTCRCLCYGPVALQAKIDFQGAGIISAPMKIHLKCDHRRVTRLCVMIDGNEVQTYGASVTAGTQFPDFAVSLFAEDGNAITDPDVLESVLMRTCRTDISSAQKNNLPSFLGPSSVDCDSGRALFQKLIVPLQSGDYAMDFLIKQIEGWEFQSETFMYKVVPSAPHSFRPVKCPNDVWVSNRADRSKRMIVHGLKFLMEDEHGNVIPDKCDESELRRFNGTLTVKLEAVQEDTPVIPQLESDSLSIPITAGTATSDPLILAENTTGENGAAYKIIFHADLPDLDAAMPDFSIRFYFMDDTQKQEKLSLLQKRKQAVSRERSELMEEFIDMSRDQQHLEQSHQTISDEFQARLAEVVSQNNGLRLKIRDGSVLEFDALIRDAEAAHSYLVNSTAFDPNASRVAPAPELPGVVGRVIHMGRVQNDEDVSIISWLMMSDMRCIITDSTAAAMQLMKSDKKSAQVLPLDLLPPVTWDQPLPHEACDPPFDASEGQPVFARHMMYFPEEEKKCRAVFGSLLSDTIVINSLDHALTYRQTLLQQGRACPTLVTRNGEKITSAGKLIMCTQSGPFDAKILRFHRIPVKELTAAQKKLEGLRELRDLAESKEQVISSLQSFVENHGTHMKEVGEQLAILDQQLKRIEMEEKEISRKRPSAAASNFESPAFKRFC